MDQKNERLLQVLRAMDPTEDELWTTDGMPRVDVVANLMQQPLIGRAEITEAAPDFSRDMAHKLRAPAKPTADGDAEDPSDPTESAASVDDVPPDLAPGDVGVPGHADIWKRPLSEIIGSLALCQEACESVQTQLAKLGRERSVIDEQIDKLNFNSSILGRALGNLQGTDTQKNQRQIQAAGRASNEARAKKAANAQAFIDAGTTREAVLEQLDPRSKLDKAMARPVGHGRGRPAPRGVSGGA